MSPGAAAWKFYAGTVGAVMLAVGMIATAAWASSIALSAARDRPAGAPANGAAAVVAAGDTTVDGP